jgi:site-specific recombinase XerD
MPSKVLSLGQVISSYLDDAALGISPNTLDIYRWNLAQMADHLSGVGVKSLRRVTPEHLRSFLLHLKEHGYRDATVHQHYRGMKTFFGWCVRQGYLTLDPMARVRAPRLPAPVHNRLDFEKIEKVLEAAKRTQQPERDYAIVVLLLDTGIRREELVSLAPDDVHLAEHVVAVRQGKGAKGREVPLSDVAAKALADWLAVRLPDTHGLFGIKTGSGLYLFTSRLSRKVGFWFSPHDLRHTFATLYGGDVQDLQKILGHADVSTTASIYRHRGVSALVKVHDERSPVANLSANK